VREHLSLRSGNTPPANNPAQIRPVAGEANLVRPNLPAPNHSGNNTGAEFGAALKPNDRLQLMIIARLYKQITGEDLQLMSAQEFLAGQEQLANTPVQLTLNAQTSANTNNSINNPTAINNPAPAGKPELVYQRQTRYSEEEKLHFAAAGEVVTAQGKQIDFNAELYMRRSFTNTSTLTLVDGKPVMTDPLVINFDGAGAELENSRFGFDLNSDGIDEQIANLRSNSGYLALDRNADGAINNGTELFGPSSNNGFAELAAFDEDNNGFLDEGDSVFNQLRIWQRDADGNSRMLSLADKNIGALYLGHVASPMQLKTADNQTLGEVASSGIYLREDGSTGLIQQINLAV
jgi:hypothetical protein